MSFRIDPGAPLEAEIRRIAAEQIDKAAAELVDAAADRHEAIHDARKRFKKLRALFRLVRHGNEAFYQAENARFRDLAGALSAARDRAALVEAIDALAAALPDDAADAGLGTVRERFAARRDGATESEGDLDARIAATLDGLGEARRALADLALPQTHKSKKAARFVAAGVRTTFGQARRALKLARASGKAEDLHILRRHVKYHGAHLQLLMPLWPDFLGPLRGAADKIADVLGEDHDLFVLGSELAVADPAARLDGLPALIDRRQQTLRTTGLGLARRLLAEEPDAVEARIERLFRLAALAGASGTAP